MSKIIEIKRQLANIRMQGYKANELRLVINPKYLQELKQEILDRHNYLGKNSELALGLFIGLDIEEAIYVEKFILIPRARIFKIDDIIPLWEESAPITIET